MMKPSTALLAVLAIAGTAQAAQLTLYKQPNFTGDKLTLRNDTTDLKGANFHDQVSSVVVNSGRWQVCTSPDFQGDCRVLEPGRYAQLDQDLNHRIESVRQLAGYAVNDCGERGERCGPRYYGYANRDQERFHGHDWRDDDRRRSDNDARDWRSGYNDRDSWYGDRDSWYGDRGYGNRYDGR